MGRQDTRMTRRCELSLVGNSTRPRGGHACSVGVDVDVDANLVPAITPTQAQDFRSALQWRAALDARKHLPRLSPRLQPSGALCARLRPAR